MPSSRFDTDTVGERSAAHTVSVDVNADWNVDGRILNGGYLQAVTVRAATDVLAAPGDPVAVSTVFAAPAQPGHGEVSVQVLRRGRRVSMATATLRQGETAVLACHVTMGSLAGDAGQRVAGPAASGRDDRIARTTPVMPAVTGPDASIRVSADRLPGIPGLARLLDMAFVPEDSGWLSGDVSAGPRIRCWLRFADDRPLDALAVIAMADMAPPVSFAQGRFGWAPTLQLQVGMFARPRGRHVLLDLRGEPYDGPFVAEDGLLWDESGTLVACSRQIAVSPRE